jgi:hypothetical protein
MQFHANRPATDTELHCDAVTFDVAGKPLNKRLKGNSNIHLVVNWLVSRLAGGQVNAGGFKCLGLKILQNNTIKIPRPCCFWTRARAEGHVGPEIYSVLRVGTPCVRLPVGILWLRGSEEARPSAQVPSCFGGSLDLLLRACKRQAAPIDRTATETTFIANHIAYSIVAQFANFLAVVVLRRNRL